MSTQITTAFVQQYSGNVQMLSQQKGSRLRRAVRVENINGEYAYFDQVGAVSMTKRTSRHADTPLSDTPHSRRKVFAEPYDYADLIDKPDRVRTLIDPTNSYAMAAAWGAGRTMDDVIIAAANGTALTGKTGATSVTLPTAQKIAVNASGLTLAKLIQAKEILDAAENDPDEPRYIAFRAKDQTTLLNTTEVKSADYNTVKALVQGQINTFLGFEFIRTERLITSTDGSSIACLAWRKSALLLAESDAPTARISERDDKNYSTQVFYHIDVGATRMEEVGIVEISVTA